MENEIVSEIIRLAVDIGIPLDKVPSNYCELVYLQQIIIFATFILGIGFKGLFKLMGSMVSGVR